MERERMEIYLRDLEEGAGVYTLTYERPPLAVTRAHANLLELLCSLRGRKAGIKYVAVTEQRPSMHHYLVLDGLEKEAVAAFWGLEGCHKELEYEPELTERLADKLTRYEDSLYSVSKNVGWNV